MALVDHQLLTGLVANFGLLSAMAAAMFMLVARYGFDPPGIQGQVAIGLAFGLMTVMVIQLPVVAPDGAVFDTRAGPVVIAGVVGGPLAAAIVATSGAVARMDIGGPYVIGGVLSFVVYALVGWAAGVLLRRRKRLSLGAVELPALAIVATIFAGPTLLVGHDLTQGMQILARSWPLILAVNIAGIVFLGLIMREMQRVIAERDHHRAVSESSLMARRLGRIGIWRYNFRTRENFWDELQLQIMDVDRTDVDAGPIHWARNVLPEDLAALRVQYEEARQYGRMFQGDFRVRTRSGEVRNIRGLAAFRGGEPGDPDEMFGVNWDVTSQVRAEREMVQSRDRLDAILESAPDAILTVDERQQITGFNRAAEQLFQWTRGEAMGAPIGMLLPPGNRPGHSNLVTRYLTEAGETSRPMAGLRIVDALRKDGEVFPALITLGRFEVQGRPAGAAIIRDMTLMVEANDALRTMSEELSKQLEIAREANATKSRFLAHMSHELRTPLNAVLGFSEMLLSARAMKLPSERVEDYARDINESGRHLLSLIEDVLEMSQIEDGVLNLELGPVNVAEVVGESVDTIALLARRRSVSIQNDVRDDLTVFVDHAALHRCIVNLLSNAARFSRTGGVVRIVSRTQADRVVIAVADRGVGIPQVLLDRITEPFVTPRNAYRAEGQSVGLGLAITRSLIERMDGEFRIDSTENVGTTVTITLPAAHAADNSDAGPGSVGVA
ncbi:MAG: ATP-binding protein [Pseudomonadota bacterium]|nr:ATP-binding protein [Pseudomonadota bacterium]